VHHCLHCTGRGYTVWCLYFTGLYFREFHEFGGIREIFLETSPTERHNHASARSRVFSVSERKSVKLRELKTARSNTRIC